MLKISVVTISFNQAQFLERCIFSVLSQDYPAVEYILVDPGSTDGSRAMIDRLGDRVVRIYEADRGPADGLNNGFKRATGDVYCFLNSDDELLPGALRAVADYFDRHADVDVVSGSGYFIDKDGRRLKKIAPSRYSAFMYAHGAVSVFQQGTFFRSRAFELTSGFNIENKTCWDAELFLDMALRGARFSVMSRDLALFRLHEGGITGSGRMEEQYRRDSLKLFCKYKGRNPKGSDSLVALLLRAAKGVFDPTYYFRRLDWGGAVRKQK